MMSPVCPLNWLSYKADLGFDLTLHTDWSTVARR